MHAGWVATYRLARRPPMPSGFLRFVCETIREMLNTVLIEIQHRVDCLTNIKMFFDTLHKRLARDMA